MPEGDGREDPRVARTREAVVRATRELVASDGAGAVTVERVAARAEVARSTIYRRWQDLDQLLVEALLPTTPEAFSPPTGDVEADIFGYLTEYAERLNDPMYFGAFLALIDRATRRADFAARHREMVDEETSRCAAILREGRRTGRLRSDLPVARAVEQLLSPFLYIRMIEHRRIDPDAVQGVLEEFLRSQAPGRQAPGHQAPDRAG